MNGTIRDIPINPNLSAQRCRELVSRVRTVRQGAIAEAWLCANKVISRDEFSELEKELNRLIREAFRRETEEYGRA